MAKKLLLWSPPVILVATVYMIYSLIVSKDNWSTDTNVDAKKIKDRTTNRGMFVSIISAIILSIVGGVMAGIKVPENMIVINYGFILGPVIGYMLDIGIGTDEGFRRLKEDKVEWFKYIFDSLVDSKFFRYIITVLLDLFISDPIQDVLRDILKPIRAEMSTEGSYSNLIASNLPSIIQGLVGFITFNAYTNQTRFNWAYPSENLSNEDKMSTFLVSLATALAGSLYIIHNKNSSDRGVKTSYVVTAISMLYTMNSFGLQKDKPKSEPNTNKSRHLIGVGLFTVFVLYGLVYPLMNAGKAES